MLDYACIYLYQCDELVLVLCIYIYYTSCQQYHEMVVDHI